TARALLEESLALRGYLGDRRGTANSLHELGKVAAFCARFDEADALFAESMAIKRELGDKQGLATSLHSQGRVALERGQGETARALFLESLQICRELDNRRGITYALEAFASLAALPEQAERAARLYGAAEALRETLGAPLPANEREEHARRVECVRTALEAAAFAAAWAEGRAMTVAQAVAYVENES
ncbi:MAG TPA: tetratricopeptide repeat protein, partial [Chthonomonadaceae bacterium]|nr:tetratricopeptide repeat protein [Chthonomonadaceae bacterium]